MIEIGPNLKDILEGVLGAIVAVFVLYLLLRNL